MNNEPIKNAAWLYYAVGLTQNEVASELGVSRQTVANYLTEARAQGYVNITLRSDILSANENAEAIKTRYSLRSVEIVPNDDLEMASERLGVAGAQALSAVLQNANRIGVASGRTLSAVARNLQRISSPEVSVVQISGSSILSADHSAEVCAVEIANRLSARCYNLHAPAYLSDDEITRQIYLEPAIAEHFNLIRKLEVIVFGVGEVTPSTKLQAQPTVPDNICEIYYNLGARTAIFGRFLNADGEEQIGPLSNRTVAISLDDARTIPTRLAVCGGAKKREALLSTLRAGLITHLILDQNLAKAILE